MKSVQSTMKSSGSQSFLQRLKQKVDDTGLSMKGTPVNDVFRRKQHMSEHFRTTVVAPFEAFETKLRIKTYQEELIKRNEIQRVASLSLSVASEVDLLSAETQDREQLVSIEKSVRDVLLAHAAELLEQMKVDSKFRPFFNDLVKDETAKRTAIYEDEKQLFLKLTDGLMLEGRILQPADGNPRIQQSLIRPRLLLFQKVSNSDDEVVPSVFSCVCATANYIACGTEGAYIRIFNRSSLEEEFYFPSYVLGGRKEDTIIQIAIDNSESYLAFATSSNQVVVGLLTGDECVVRAQHNTHTAPIRALAFAECNGCILLSGDDAGQVAQTRIPAATPDAASNPTLVLQAETGIVQIYVSSDTVSISTTLRTYLVSLKDTCTAFPVGSQPHRRPAMHGACILPGGVVYVSRANGTLWKAKTVDGKVLSTLKFPDDIPQVRQPSLVFQVGNSRDLLVLISDIHAFTLVNINRVAMVCSEQLLPVLRVCAHGTSIYALCQKVSSQEIVVLHIDIAQAALNDIARSEEVARNKVSFTEDVARLKTEEVT